MKAFPSSVRTVIRLLGSLPGLGEKSATRIAMYLIQKPEKEVLALAEAIIKMKKSVTLCKECFHLADDDLCAICQDPKRRSDQICVVETTTDVIAIEQSGIYGGRYHVLGGVINPLENVGPERLNIEPLLKRIERGGVEEIIIATNPTSQGEATARYLYDLLKDRGIKLTRIGVGIPAGGDIKYADPLTLKQAIESRRVFQ
ncbi:recombination mediator RecR [Thermodesulforhabdus norvegica]|uniref:Recombination protein RecR n=1 Tax=Thermodesulforhabdus norvegica TaxID=39841 RepID=A0A1I4TSW7_9BACT|nr:recombination mediator RecR [Thermodesulforhabdus norvegica]SFM79882.1 DNA replication and repair protein RecR [Thermodesulforhabdus norvegica]